MYYLQSRYYDPEIGRFINADGQISGVGGDFLGYNQFAYCFNNPVNLEDSSGNWPKLSNLLKGASWLAIGVTAVCVGLSALTCGVAAPAMMAVAAVTVGAGALTAINGVAEVGEAFTGYNIVRDTVFDGNQTAYDAYANSTAAIAETGTAICGGWSAKNSPRVNTYKNVDTYNVKDKHLSTGSGTWGKFNTTSQSELRALAKEALKNSPMDSLIPNSSDSYKVIYDFGRVIGTSGETSARLVFSDLGKIITFFPE